MTGRRHFRKFFGYREPPSTLGLTAERSLEPSIQPPAQDQPPSVRLPFPAGHFYSPVVDPATLDRERIWPASPDVRGIDFKDASHRRVLSEDFPRFYPDYDYPHSLPDTPDLARFFTFNSQFSGFDPCLLFVLLRAYPPRRLIEVGSGYSSLLVADVNRRWLGGALDVRASSRIRVRSWNSPWQVFPA